MSTWGGFKTRVHGVLAGWLFSGLISYALFGFGRELLIWGTASFLGSLIGPILNGSNQAIWQAKVAPDLQGRVFSTRRLIAWLTTPITPLIAGPLADYILEPAMKEGGSLAGTFSWLVGTGPGAGMALIMIFAGVFASLVGLAGYFIPTVRQAETLLPDHGQDAAAEGQPEKETAAMEESMAGA